MIHGFKTGHEIAGVGEPYMKKSYSSFGKGKSRNIRRGDRQPVFFY